MKHLDQIRHALTRGLEVLDQYGKDLVQPIREGCDVVEAARRLRDLLGEGEFFSIDMKIELFSSDKQEVTWRIWDGLSKRHFESPRLESAVNAVLAAHVPQPAQPLLSVQEAMPAPVPF